jgi:hypothetical protein
MGYWSIVPPGGSSACDLSEHNITVREAGGFGMPPVRHRTFDRPLLPGKSMQGFKTEARTFALTVQFYGGTSLCEYHQRRSDLISMVKPQTEQEAPSPAYLRYTISGSTLQLPVFYAGGLEGRRGEGTEETAGVKVVAYDPYWTKTACTTTVLGVSDSIACSAIIARIDGIWASLSTGMNGFVYGLAIDSDGDVYAVGNFDRAGGTTASGVARWSKADQTWYALSSGLGTNGYGLAVVIDANDDAIIGGSFQLAGGTAACGIVRWDKSASTFVSLSSGIPGEVTCLAISPCNTLYAGGNYTEAGGTPASRMSSFANGTFTALSSGLNDVPYAIAVAANAEVYVTGPFTQAGGTSVSMATRWADGTFYTMGTTGCGRALAVTRGGLVYRGSIGPSTTGSFCGMWDGNDWQSLTESGSLNSGVYTVAEERGGNVFFGGTFSRVGGLTAWSMARWNGYTWARYDLEFLYQPTVRAVAVSGRDLYVGFAGTSGALKSASTVVTNSGFANVYPVIAITGSGTLVSIGNATTGAELLFNLYVNTGETITLDLRPSIDLRPETRPLIHSSWRGGLFGEMLPGQDFASLYLQPGANTITMFISGSGAECAACCYHFDSYLSVDDLF